MGEDYIPDLPDDLEPPLESMEEIPEEEIVDPNAMVDSFGTDDPVRMYLKEIGKVNLLTSEEEVELAQDMTSGTAAQEQLDELTKAGEEIPPEVRAELDKAIKKGERARQRLAEAGVKCVSLTDLDTIAQVGVQQGYITQGDVARLLAFRDDPSDENWIRKGE